MRKRRKLDVVCPNPACQDHGEKSLRNIIRSGKKTNGTQNYRCITCNRQFVRTAGTIFYRSRIKKKEAKKIANLLVEKIGLRGISRATERNKNTLVLFTNKLAERCKQVNDFLLQDVQLSPIEVDELWTFVKKNKRGLSKKTIQMLNRETALHTSQ